MWSLPTNRTAEFGETVVTLCPAICPELLVYPEFNGMDFCKRCLLPETAMVGTVRNLR